MPDILHKDFSVRTRAPYNVHVSCLIILVIVCALQSQSPQRQGASVHSTVSKYLGQSLGNFMLHIYLMMKGPFGEN